MALREKLFFGTFLVLIVLTAVTAAAALAASNGGLTLIGFVPELHSLTIDTSAVTSNRAPAAELAASSEDIELARIVEINNAPGLYAVTIRSKNLGTLNGAGEIGPSYALSYNAAPVNLARGTVLVDSGYRVGGTRTVHVLKIHLNSQNPGQLADVALGKYSDTITFSVAAD